MAGNSIFGPARSAIVENVASIGHPLRALVVNMCLETVCKNEKCGKKTWWGCGQHIDSVMSNIPEHEKCKCETNNPATPGVGSVLSGIGSKLSTFWG